MQMHRALYAEAGGGDGGSAGGAADGGSPQGEQGKSPKDGEWIPKARFDEAIGGLKDKVRDLESRLAAAPQKEPDPPKRYTRTELKALVIGGQINEDQANDLWDQQVREEVKSTAAQTAHETVSRAERERRISGDIAQYKRLTPEILQDGHETRDRVREEFNYLVSLGHPKSVETELAALRAALGPIERLEKARSGRSGAEHHQESGGSGAGNNQSRDRGSGKLVETLTPREKDYYQKMIDGGQYKDWDDVEGVLKHAKPNIRRQHGASV